MEHDVGYRAVKYANSWTGDDSRNIMNVFMERLTAFRAVSIDVRWRINRRSMNWGTELLMYARSVEKICFELKNAWSRSTLILFKLHDIW